MSNTTKQSKSFSVFDFVKAIIDTKQSWESFTPEQQKQFNKFMVNKVLSMNRKYIDVVNYVQKLNIENNKKIYDVYCWMIPQSKNTYSQFIKAASKKSTPDELLNHVKEYFECSIKEAEEYVQLMENEYIVNVLTSRGVDEKEIKKLIK